MPVSRLAHASKWISPSVLLRVADMIGLPLTSRAERAAALQCAAKTVTILGRGWPYAVWNPTPRPALASLPVILFLHGAGERGSDGQSQTKVGLGPALCRFPDRYPAHIVMPQCPVGSQWSGGAEQAALSALAHTIKATGADERRVYVTGVSMGAHGALSLAARHPSLFAAVVAICGWATANQIANQIKHLPLWLFHDQASSPVAVSRH